MNQNIINEGENRSHFVHLERGEKPIESRALVFPISTGFLTRMSPMNHGRGKLFSPILIASSAPVDVNASFRVSLTEEASFTSDLGLTREIVVAKSLTTNELSREKSLKSLITRQEFSIHHRSGVAEEL
jgi:hypothetical protein